MNTYFQYTLYEIYELNWQLLIFQKQYKVM